MPREMLDIGSAWENAGRQIGGGGDAYEAGYSKMSKALGDAALKKAHTDLYQTQANQIKQRGQYQNEGFGSKIGAQLAGLNDAQSGQLEDFSKRGNWGLSADAMPEDVAGPPMVRANAAPDWATPQTMQKYNMGKAVHLMNLGATGNSNVEQAAEAFAKLLGQGRIDAAMADPKSIPTFGSAMAASQGKPLYHQGTNGVMQLFTGQENLNDVGRSAAKENVAQAANAYASAGQHNAKTKQINSEMNGGGLEGFSPAAIDAAASRYNMDGTLPPMGMGKEGALGRRTILNRAAEMAGNSGVSPDDQRIAQIGNKANTAAMSKLQQQQTMVGAFEKNFVKNADIALELSDKVDRTGTPILNKWVNVGKRSIGGDPDLAAFDQAIKSASNEYAKIISGSMGNTAVAEGEIKKMEDKLNAAQTPAQVKAVIDLMKRETQNRMTAFDDEKSQLRESMKGGRAAEKTASNTSSVISKSSALSGVPDGALAYLKANPASVNAFAAKYGKDAADAALGKVK